MRAVTNPKWSIGFILVWACIGIVWVGFALVLDLRYKTYGLLSLLFLSFFLLCLLLYIQHRQNLHHRKHKELKKQRRVELLEKFKDEKIVDCILEQVLFEGQTYEMIVESFGPPDIQEEEVDVRRPGTRYTFLYLDKKDGSDRLAVTVENGNVRRWRTRRKMKPSSISLDSIL